jgi:hypothetical protein
MADEQDVLNIEYYFDGSRKQTNMPGGNSGHLLGALTDWGTDWHSKIVSGFHGENSKQGKGE